MYASPFPIIHTSPRILVHKVICAQHIVPTPGKASPPPARQKYPKTNLTLLNLVCPSTHHPGCDCYQSRHAHICLFTRPLLTTNDISKNLSPALANLNLTSPMRTGSLSHGWLHILWGPGQSYRTSKASNSLSTPSTCIISFPWRWGVGYGCPS